MSDGCIVCGCRNVLTSGYCEEHQFSTHNYEPDPMVGGFAFEPRLIVIDKHDTPTAIVAALRELPADVLAQVVRELCEEMEIPY